MGYCKFGLGDIRLINIYLGLLIDWCLFKSVDKCFGFVKLKNEGKNN